MPCPTTRWCCWPGRPAYAGGAESSPAAPLGPVIPESRAAPAKKGEHSKKARKPPRGILTCGKLGLRGLWAAQLTSCILVSQELWLQKAQKGQEDAGG